MTAPHIIDAVASVRLVFESSGFPGSPTKVEAEIVLPPVVDDKNLSPSELAALGALKSVRVVAREGG